MSDLHEFMTGEREAASWRQFRLMMWGLLITFTLAMGYFSFFVFSAGY